MPKKTKSKTVKKTCSNCSKKGHNMRTCTNKRVKKK